MKTRIFFVARIALAWLALFLLLLIFWNIARLPGPHWSIVFLALLVLFGVVAAAFSHMRRVRMIADVLDDSALSIHQRRQIDIPAGADEAFAIVEAAIRELPRIEDIECARDSLQIRARERNLHTTNVGKNLRADPWYWLQTERNQILATVKPGDHACRLTLICEPEGGAWREWFTVDNGTNLETAEAISRAITRRIAERRKGEEAAARQTVTEKELTVAKLNLLHAQVEPHFLYNTLASAQILTRTDPARAEDMLGNLITYLRHSLPRTDDGPSTLGVELERARAYLQILKIRMGDRLNLTIEVGDDLKGTPMPAMMLQTLVENAIKHGLEPKSGGGTIWILGRRVEDKVAVTVADDGRGFNAESSGTGIGLKNVRERLRLAYGDAASFSIVANFPSGVAATVTVPATGPQGASND
jgi:hypothetical protein